MLKYICLLATYVVSQDSSSVANPLNTYPTYLTLGSLLVYS